MKYRLDTDHYIYDRVIPEGTVIGDDTDFAFRYADGSAMPPSREMTPLDDEAKKIVLKRFPEGRPDSDPTKAVPLLGTFSEAKVPPKIAPAKPVVHGVTAPPVPVKETEK